MIEDDDERLIVQFFQEHKMEIPDDGFTRRVSRRLPHRNRNLSCLWTMLCSCAGVVLFLLIDGIDSLRLALGNVAGDLIGAFSSFSITGMTPVVVFVAVITLLSVTVSNLLSAE